MLSLRNRQIGPSRPPVVISERLVGEIAERKRIVAEGFTGVSTSEGIIPNLFPIQSTGLSSAPMVDAARAFLGSFSAIERAAARYPINGVEWREWNNESRWMLRHGICFEDMTEGQKELGLGLLRASLSEEGFTSVQSGMRLNYTLGEEWTHPEVFGEWCYWLAIFGEPSETEPWGWQLDGHHLNVSCLVLGDQIVMTPFFLGCEPSYAKAGRYQGTSLFVPEEAAARNLIRNLTPTLRTKAVVSDVLPGDCCARAFRDNEVIDYVGITYEKMTGEHQGRLTELIDVWVGRMRSEHAKVRMDEVLSHSGDMVFAWFGPPDEDNGYYYRIQSPVILIEFSHQHGWIWDNDYPTGNHIHSIIRTPNGNDYGMDLLRQHFA
jgi:Protein of unknown function (DUF3500)